MPLSPLNFLLIVAAITIAAAALDLILAARHRRRLRALASQWRMHYTPDDRFQLTSRISARLPMPGAADVHVTDVIYASEGDNYRYFFTVTYTSGVLRRKTDHHSVCRVIETKGSREHDVAFSSEQGAVLEQYAQLRNAPDAAPAIGLN
jgi:hypothetical protein